MRALALCVFAVLAGFASADVYQVLHRRPSSLLGILGQGKPQRLTRISGGGGLVPNDVVMTADDKASTITIDGPPEAVKEMMRMLAEFDIAARQVIAHITLRSKADKYESTIDVRINNNAPWSFTDGVTNANFAVSPRINGDGTVTGKFNFTGLKNVTDLVARMKGNEPLTIGLTDSRLVLKDKKAPFDPDVEITVKFEVLGLSGAGAIEK